MLPPLQRAAESAAPRPKPAPAPGGAPPPPSPRKPAPPPASAAPRPQKAESAEGSDDADDFSVAPSLAMPPWATPDFASTGVIRIGIAASSPAEVQALKEALERLLGAHVSLEVISSRVGSLQIADVHAAAKARGWCIGLGTPLSQAVRDEAADFGVWCAEFPTMAAVTTFAQQLAAMLATKAGT